MCFDCLSEVKPQSGGFECNANTPYMCPNMRVQVVNSMDCIL
jgi:hypothetical protein